MLPCYEYLMLLLGVEFPQNFQRCLSKAERESVCLRIVRVMKEYKQRGRRERGPEKEGREGEPRRGQGSRDV